MPLHDDDTGALSRAVAGDAVAAGAWAVGVSGGPDSVALVRLLRQHRPDVALHVVHLDHQTRGTESTADAHFVAQLARELGLACTVERRDRIEPTVPDLPTNPSARFRKLRHALFGRVVREHGLVGVILAHHADDQAETVLSRLLRGSGAPGLAGMIPCATIGNLLILRPLLALRREQLRAYLEQLHQPWRTDTSNVSPAYQRNRLRALLEGREELFEAAIDLARTCRELRDWARAAAPVLDETFAVGELADLPAVLAREAARRWLVERRVPAEDVGPDVIERLVTMSRDAASAGRAQFPGGVVVRRRRGEIFVEQR